MLDTNLFKIPSGSSDFLPERANLAQLQSDFGKYIVPLYQRTYRWDEENCEQFIEDIFNIVFSDNTDHFFNSMVFIKDKNTQVRTIVDGQQRLITSLLLFYAKVKLFGGNFELKEKQFMILNEKNHLGTDGFDFYDFFANTERNGYVLPQPIKTIIDEDRVKAWKSILSYCVANACTSNYLSYIFEMSDDFDNILDNPKHKERLEKYFLPEINVSEIFSENYEYGLEISQNSPQSAFLLANVILFCLFKDRKSKKQKGITEFKLLLEEGNKVTEEIKKVAISALFSSDDKNIRRRLKNDEITYQNLPDQVIDWVGLSGVIINHFLQFFSKFEDSFQKKKKTMQPYVNNYRFIIDFLRKKYEEFVKTLIKHKIELKSYDLFKHSSYQLKGFFDRLLEKAFDHSFFITVEVSNPDPKVAIDLALTAFSSINSAGEPLESFDIIKSDLYGKCSTEMYEGMNAFLTINKDKISMKKDDLLKFFFAAENANYKKEKIYRQFRNYIKKEEDSRPRNNAHEAFVRRFMDFCEVKYQVDNGLFRNSEGGYTYVASLHLLASFAKKIQTLYSLIYSTVKSQLLDQEKIRLLNHIYGKFIIYSIAGDNKSLVGIFENFIKMINKTDPINDIVAEVDKRFALNNLKEELRLRFIDPKRPLYNEAGKQITIIREGYARATTNNPSYKSLKINFNLIAESTTEHIYHRSAPVGESYEGFVGNFTLLEGSQNSSASNKQYVQKIGYHLESGLIISREILQYHIDKYNKQNPHDPTYLDNVQYERISGENNSPKYTTVIKTIKGTDVTSQFNTNYLDLDWLVGDIDPDSPKIGGLTEQIIEILSSPDNKSILLAVNELETNPNCSCDTSQSFEPIKFSA